MLHPPSLLLLAHDERLASEVEYGASAYRLHRADPDAVIRAQVLGEPSPLCKLAHPALVLVEWADSTVPGLLAIRNAARRHGLPLFVLCGPKQTDHVAALVVGADAVLPRPFSLIFMEARLEAYRRSRPPMPLLPPALAEASRAPSEPMAVTAPAASPPTPPAASLSTPPQALDHDVLSAGPFRMDRTARRFYVQDHEFDLRPKEYDLMALLMAPAETCRSRDELLQTVWGLDFETGTNILDVVVYALRQKLATHDLQQTIETVRGVGYRLSLTNLATS